jgi:hypothetical protein
VYNGAAIALALATVHLDRQKHRSEKSPTSMG